MGRKKGSTDMKHSLTRPDPDGIEMKQRIYKPMIGDTTAEVAKAMVALARAHNPCTVVAYMNGARLEAVAFGPLCTSEEALIGEYQSYLREPPQEVKEPVWVKDPAASGTRFRMQAEGYDHFAYEDGRWQVLWMKDPHHVQACGQEETVEAARERCLRVRQAMELAVEHGSEAAVGALVESVL